MAILTVNNIKKMFGTDVIIQDITFEVQKGDRIGLVGINGSGKTTLFKVLNGEYTADEGTFTPARETSIGYMEQHVCRDMEKPAFDEVMTVFAPLLKMEAEIEVLTTKISEMPEMCGISSSGRSPVSRIGWLHWKHPPRNSLWSLPQGT